MKNVECRWDKIGKNGNSREKLKKNPDIDHHNCPPGDTEIRTGVPSRGQTSGLTARASGRLASVVTSSTSQLKFYIISPIKQ